MLRANLVRIGYLLGVSLILASIVYFFAANWAGLERHSKVLLAAGLVALFYGAAYAFSWLRALHGHRFFIGNLLLAAGCLAFGIAVMLLGQIYNSHADSYVQFLVWTVAALLFALVSRYTPFYVMTFVLGHLTLWFYFYPTMLTYHYSELRQAAIYALFAALNALVAALGESGKLNSGPVKPMAYLVFHSAVLMLSNSFVLGDLGKGLNALAVAVLAACFYYYGRVRTNRLYLTLTALAFSAFAVLKFMELAEAYASSLFFFYGLVFVALLLTGNVLFFRYLQKMPSSGHSGKEETAAQDGQPAEQADGGGRPTDDDRAGALAGRIVSIIVTVVGIMIGTISLIGMVFMFSGDIDPENILFLLSLLFVLPMLFLPGANPVVRYAVIAIGYLGGLASLFAIGEPVITFLFVPAVIAGWIRLTGQVQRVFIGALINANLLIAFGQATDGENWAYIVLTLSVLNGAAYALLTLLPRCAPDDGDNGSRGAKPAALFFALLFLFWLTFLESIFPYAHEIFNLLNFVLVTALVFHAIRRGRIGETWIALAFWFAFLAYKYYDLLWSLLHKSLTLALVGLLFLAATFAFSRREHGGEPPRDSRFLHARWPVIVLVVVLQFGYIGFQTLVSERLLANGALIKLELAPLDPRSLLQGDYVRLNYEISTPPQAELDELRSAGRTRVRVALNVGADGLCTFGRFVPEGEQQQPGELVVNGVFDGWNAVHYGIESYFIPEGTGTAVEDRMRYAYVRIGKDGNALIERLAED